MSDIRGERREGGNWDDAAAAVRFDAVRLLRCAVSKSAGGNRGGEWTLERVGCAPWDSTGGRGSTTLCKGFSERRAQRSGAERTR